MPRMRSEPRSGEGVLEAGWGTIARGQEEEDDSEPNHTLCRVLPSQAVRRLQGKAFLAAQQLEQVQHQAEFELEKERREHGKRLEEAKGAGLQQVRRRARLRPRLP